VPWARPGSPFTLLFEAFMLSLAPPMSVAQLASPLRVGDDPLWRVLNHHTQAARAQESYADVRDVGVEETAFRRGQSSGQCQVLPSLSCLRTTLPPYLGVQW